MTRFLGLFSRRATVRVCSCVFLAFSNHFGGHGHTLCSDPDYGYAQKPARRKVVLWSTSPWSDIDVVGDKELPTGRYVAGTTETAIGPVKFIGVCIPWFAAHVSTGRKNRARWEDHCSFLEGLERIVAAEHNVPIVVAGDFNQTVPRTRAPIYAFDKMAQALKPLNIGTAGVTDSTGSNTIDHVCHSSELLISDIQVISKEQEGSMLSDHFGINVAFSQCP